MNAKVQKLRVHSITYAAKDIIFLELRSPDGSALPLFTPGAHIQIKMSSGLVRSYSLLNGPEARDRYIIGVQRDAHSRGGSQWMHDSVKVGQILDVLGPYNNFPLEAEAEASTFIAGGIGITPLWSMIQHLEALGRPWNLHYRTRSGDTALLMDRLEPHLISGKAVISIADQSDRGAFDIARIVQQAPPGAHLYCCGPVSMMAEFLEACKTRPANRVHVEHFQTQEAPAAGGGFTVRLARSNRTIQMTKGKSILSAVLELGIDAPYSCQEGLCGECETRVIAGLPDHRDLYLTQAEKKAGSKIMICCSGSLTPELELDL